MRAEKFSKLETLEPKGEQSIMTTEVNRYPIYLVNEQNSFFEASQSEKFKIADPGFRAKIVKLVDADHTISFRAYTELDHFCMNLRYETVPPEADGEVALFFNFGHTRRKRHQAFSMKFKQDGSVMYEEFLYEIERLEIPQDIHFSISTSEGYADLTLRMPLRFLRIESQEQRILGFNAVRTLKRGSETTLITWSGIPGDRPTMGFGMGDLLLTRGMSEEEIETRKNKVQAESTFFFTRWEKWKIPQEIYGYMTEKRKGFTARLTRADVDRARESANTTHWGGRVKEEILQIAEYWAAKSDDELFELVPVGNPRALSVGQYFGDPLTGGKRTAYQLCLERPYQYYNPTTQTWWYNGMKLQNPTTGEEVVMDDDGQGFLAPEGFPNPGVRYMFTASYRLFILSMLMGNPYCSVLEDRTVCEETTGMQNSGAINNLAYAYLLTGDTRYAFKALLLIGRIAELVPYMNGNYGSGYYDTVQISEPTTTESHWLSNFFEAADLLYEAGEELRPDLDRFFATKPDAENKTRADPFRVNTAIHEMIPYILYSCEIEKTRDADWSLRWIYLQLLIASYMGSGKLMRHILYGGKYSLESKFRNNFFRDGRYIYDSLGYIAAICEQVSMMANNNYGFTDEEHFPNGIDLFEDSDFGLKQVIGLFAKLRSGSLTPMFGDTLADNDEPISEDRRKGKIAYTPSYEIIYCRSPSLRSVIGGLLSRYDQDELIVYRLRSVRETNNKHSFLLLATAAEWEEYQQFEAKSEQLQPSFLLQDSETSMFRVGTNAHNCKHVMLYGQPSAGHRHGDKLGLWIGGYGYHLLASAGRYPFTWLSPKFEAWETHAAACTVALVDGKDQVPSYSRQKGHYEGVMLQMAGLDNTIAYPGTHYERWCWIVQAPDLENAYIVDFNGLSGGKTFDYNTVGMDCTPEFVLFEGIEETEWLPMEGTLAGSDVPLYSRPGFGWMKALRKAKVSRPVSWTFPYGAASLKIHTVPKGEQRELILCLGERGGEEMQKSRWEPYVLWRDEDNDDAAIHSTGFISVLEPFEGKSFLQSIHPLEPVLDFTPHHPMSTGIVIQYKGGVHRDVVLSSYNEGEKVRYRDSLGRIFESDAKALLLRYQEDQLVQLEAVRYSLIRTAEGEWTADDSAYRGAVTKVDAETRTIGVELERVDESLEQAFIGQVALIDSADYLKPSAYYIYDPQLDGRLLSFRSDMTLIKLEESWPSPHKRLGMGNKKVIEYGGKRVYMDVKLGDSFKLSNVLRLNLERKNET
ncbi:hypothetical protein [Paenibacillus sp. Root444D2]|uniref:hypothetical protein n=1 Tax=Paenibacillus sp. Root444D2 TaxID=1736538 RepID=UPI00070E24EF|nr:hypothetical protein [Paenibacillus sp. Root444D2]KQX48857.1 hypothetical protein ASD40_11900 [Paenibacillus sp. Root444D2]